LKECREFLIDRGYDTSVEGGNYFVDLVEEVVCFLNQDKSIEEIRELLPSLYLEYYHFYYEVSKFKYMNALNNFNSCGLVDKTDDKCNKNESLEDKLLRLGADYYKLNKEEKKVYKKTIM
jgi:hypothetical protein